MISMLQGLMGWLGLLVSAAGFAVSVVHRQRSRWGGLLLLGFGAELAASLFYRVAPVFLGSLGGYDFLQPMYLLASLVGLAGHAAVVGAVAGLLLERRENRAGMPPPFVRASRDAGDARP